MNLPNLIGAVLALAAFLASAQGAEGKTTEVCPRLALHSRHGIDLSESEAKLVCGSAQSPAWKNVPDNQVIFHLRAFLQTRGYYHPKFELRDEQIHVEVGEPTRATRLSIEGGAAQIDESRLRRIVGELLTPALLNAVTERLTAAYQVGGFPCPQIKVEANFNTGEILASVTPGAQQKITFIDHELIEGVDGAILSRFHAFRLGDEYNSNYLALTNQRILDDAVVQSSYFVSQCQKDGAAVFQHFVAGPPRLVRFGVGVDTEQLLVGRASWRSSRLGSSASNIELSARASFIAQNFTASGIWYLVPTVPRFSLRPTVRIEHNNPAPYEELTGQIRLAPTLTAEAEHVGYTFATAPSVTFTKTLRGEAPNSLRFFSLLLRAEVKDHTYELFRSSPRTGFEGQVDAEFTHRDIWSDITAQRLHFSLQHLWNLRNYDPPFLVLGIRADGGVILSDTDIEQSSLLPLGYRFFLGGSPDLRGFSYRELPSDGKGALSYATTSFEARFADLLPWGVQPFAFVDVGLIGRKQLKLDMPLLWSPGVGVRWESPVGVIRTTVAKGLFDETAGLDKKHSHWQFYFSLGEEF